MAYLKAPRMAYLDDMESKEVEEVFTSAQDLVEWTDVIIGRNDLKKYVILQCLGDSIFSQRFYCTEIFNLSKRKDDFDIFAEEVLTNADLTGIKIRQMKTLFNEYLDSRSESGSSTSLIPSRPILKKQIELRFINIEDRCCDSDSDGGSDGNGDGNGDGNARKYVLGRKMSSGSFSIVSEVKSLTDLSCDF